MPATAARLTAALAHRGPDAEWFWTDRCAAEGRVPRAGLPESTRLALGHRRLSIVDLNTGDQPMSNEDGTVWVVFNGEIYNSPNLRRELARNHEFRTQSDTEVLVHGWEAWGPDLLGRLNGIFAFALIDRRGASTAPLVWLARDPVGAKPLYLGVTDGMRWFASELTAARTAGLLRSALRSESIAEFLVYRFVPSPGTIYENAWKVPPGHYCRLDGAAAQPTFERFAPRFGTTPLPTSSGEWEAAIRSGLDAAVRRQLMSDVPLGTLLSGGIDSTAVSRCMRDALAEPPLAFAIGLEDGSANPELEEARRSAAALELPLVACSVSEQTFLAAWPASIQGMGEPIANSGLLLVGLLCRRVRQDRKVVLSGQGADEPLGGYPRHVAERWYPLARRLGRVLRLAPDRLAAGDRLPRLRRMAGEPDRSRRFTELLAVMSPAEAVRLTGLDLDPGALTGPVRRWLDQDAELDSVNALLRVDARLSLADDLLLVADAMSMASSVELRVPFLDLELLALFDRMPSRYKISNLGERKWLYRRSVAPLLPGSIRTSLVGWRARTGRKLGFTTPLDAWYAAWLQRDATSYLTGHQARLPAFLNAAEVGNVIAEASRASGRRHRQLLGLFVLETWLRSAVQ